MTRREFVATTAGAASLPPPAGRFRKGVCRGIFPQGTPLVKCFQEAKQAGFDGLEVPIGGEIAARSTPQELERLLRVAQDAGVTLVCLWASEVLSENPLNHPDAAVRARGVEGVKRCIEIAQALRCGALLVIPGRLGSGARFMFGYQETWKRATAELEKLVPYAAQAKVILAIENVWNKFLVSPLEMRAFIDQFKSPWVQAQFDIGNVMQFGYPEDWILTLGGRVKRVHFKDYKLSTRAEQGRFVDLLEGDVNWKAVMAALVKVDYRGWVCPEIGHDPKEPDQLKKLSAAVDRILALA
jgi:hexulose-6-phosphate isomerase